MGFRCMAVWCILRIPLRLKIANSCFLLDMFVVRCLFLRCRRVY